MTELELYKFLEQQNDTPSWDGDQLIAWISNEAIKKFADIIENSYLSDANFDVILLPYGDIALDIVPLCDHFGINPEELYEK